MAKKSTSLTITLHIDGARETLAAFRRLPKEASKSLRERTLLLSETLARKVADAARQDSSQSWLLAATVKARKDRVPSIQAGGTKPVGRQRRRSRGQGPTRAYMLLFGSEFGANLPQFRPHLGRGSYWFFRTVEQNESHIADAWTKVADDVLREFRRG